MHKRKVTGQDFFERPALVVARDLLGKYLVRKVDGREVALMITETEAYFGTKDLGSHSSRGKTPRNAPMFDEAGTIYVYFTYGMHWMLNIVCGRKDFPAAVLIRGLVGSPETLSKETLTRPAKNLRSGEMNGSPTPAQRIFAGLENAKLNGPAKLTKFLQIDKKLNGKKLGKGSGLWIENRGMRVPRGQIQKTPRIGIPNRGEWTHKPWRFVLKELHEKSLS